jgi:hypothetical protein
MAKIPTHRIVDWFSHPDTHPVVIDMCRAELKRRGLSVEG